jgi:ABC-2 type transport system permease protein
VRELSYLFRIELTNWRWSWRILVLGGAMAPLMLIAGLGAFAQDSGPRALSYVLTGNVVLTLLFGMMDTLQSRFIFMRINGTLDYYRTLPIRRAGLIMAVVGSFFLLSLPSVLVTIVGGSLMLRVSLNPHPLLLVVVLVSALPMAAIGAVIGLTSSTPEAANAVRSLVAIALLVLGPVLIPPERLPGWFTWIGQVSPTVRAASALRQTLLGPVTTRLAVDLLLLGGMTFAGFWVVLQRLDWRRG